MSIKRTATAKWKGNGKGGEGTLSSGSGILSNTPYSFATRFEDKSGTNPEELIGAAHSGCFSMKLAFVLQEAGFTADSIETKATVHLADGAIPEIDLELRAKIPNISQDEFMKSAEEAKQNCPISKLFKAKINLSAKLE